jgi:hypothetical protein
MIILDSIYCVGESKSGKHVSLSQELSACSVCRVSTNSIPDAEHINYDLILMDRDK